jgi:hypothetical protein
LTVVAFISSNDMEERPPFEHVLYLNEETIKPETDLDTPARMGPWLGNNRKGKGRGRSPILWLGSLVGFHLGV